MFDAMRDYDGDGLTDGQEVVGWLIGPIRYSWGSRQLYVHSSAETRHSDKDGIPDNDEWSTAHDTDPMNVDTDQDGLYDGWNDANRNGILDTGEVWGEKQYGTDPRNYDTDGDGLHDGIEVNTPRTSSVMSDDDYSAPSEWFRYMCCQAVIIRMDGSKSFTKDVSQVDDFPITIDLLHDAASPFTYYDFTSEHDWEILVTDKYNGDVIGGSRMSEFHGLLGIQITVPLTITSKVYIYEKPNTPTMASTDMFIGFTFQFEGGYTSPTKWDTDNDGMPDGWEVQYGAAPFVKDANGDIEGILDVGQIESYGPGDGLKNIWEYQLDKNPLMRDCYGFNHHLTNEKITIALQWDASSQELNNIEAGIRKASRFLYDATDGYFFLEKVRIVNNDPLWSSHPQIRIYNAHAVQIGDPHWPQVIGGAGGIQFDPAAGYYIELPRYWEDPVVPPTDRRWSIMFAHEWTHYALWSLDEYKDMYGKNLDNPFCSLMGREFDTLCWFQHGTETKGQAYQFLTTPYDYAVNPMGYDTNTWQWSIYHESTWETIFRKYNSYTGEYFHAIEFDFNRDGIIDTEVPADYRPQVGPDLPIIELLVQIEIIP
jgi:hypothetical protein